MAIEARSSTLVRQSMLGIVSLGLGLGILATLVLTERDSGLFVGAAMYLGGAALAGAGIGILFGHPYRWALILIVVAVIRLSPLFP